MKKKNITLFIICAIIFMQNFNLKLTKKEICNAKSETTVYAKALFGCVLYRSQIFSENLEDIYFIVPETYFVSVLEMISDDCFKVQYKKYIGYVDSSTVVIATFIPLVKTLDNVTFDIKETSGTQIWSLPSTNGSVYTTITAGTKKINYIGMCYGDIPNGGESNLWYYVSYVPSYSLTNFYEGYVYSENTTNLSGIVANAENNFEPISEDEDKTNYLYVSPNFKTIVIIVLIIPFACLFLIVLSKIFLNKNKKTKKEISVQKNDLKESLERYKKSSFIRKNNNFYEDNYKKNNENQEDDLL